MEQIGSPSTPQRRRRGGFAVGLFAAGLIMGVTLAGLNLAGAQTTPTPDVPAVEEKSARPFAGKGMRMGAGPKHALHGEFTTPAPDGGYQRMAMQRGEVTAVSSSSLTVKSEDGFTRTYAVDETTMVNAGRDGIEDVDSGDQVHVMAVLSGDDARAVQVHDRTKMKESRARWMPRRESATG